MSSKSQRARPLKRRTRSLRCELLEDRRLLTISPAAMEFIYELNVARHDPQAYEDAVGLPNGMLDGVDPQPPLALHNSLVDSAEFHATEMADNNYFAHQSQVTGDHPNKMAVDAGYPLDSGAPLNANYIESLAAGTFLTDPNETLKELIEDANVNPPGHRYHLLATGPDQSFWEYHQEIGVGHAYNGSATYRNYWAIHTGYRDAAVTVLTGVVFDDANSNGSYDAGEGLGGVTIDTGVDTTTTNSAGGWSLLTSAGAYDIIASGGSMAGVSTTTATVGSDNVEVDFISGQTDGYVNFVQTPGPPPPPPPGVLDELHSADSEGAGAATIDTNELTPVLNEAIARWEAASPRAKAASLQNLDVQLSDLPSGMLLQRTDAALLVDRNAAGWGWHVDASPAEDSEFTERSDYFHRAATTGAAASQFDLLTALLHGLGRQLGHIDQTNVGDPAVDTMERGVRRSLHAPQAFSVGDVRAGIPATDSAAGQGYILYSQELIFQRFPDVNPALGGSEHMIAVMWEDNQWKYDTNSQRTPFTPVETDVLVASVDFSADTMSSLQGEQGARYGIRYGYVDGDLTFQADAYGVNPSPNDGEFVVQGTWFEAQMSGGRDYHTLSGAANVGARDTAAGSGYLMWSDQSLFSRFSPAPVGGSSHNVIAVSYSNGQWRYDNNGSLYSFTPNASDVLLASVDFTNNTVTPLAEGYINGVAAGYSDGDLTFYAETWGGAPDTGEFYVTGTWFETSNDQRLALAGVAANDGASGVGYILHSEQPLGDRLGTPMLAGASDHYIAVIHDGSQWLADRNGSYLPLTPQPSDTLIAEVNFSTDTTVSLAGVWSSDEGIRRGYAYGDIHVVANQWNGVANGGEFDVEGTFFVPNGPLLASQLGPVNGGVAALDNATGLGYLMWSDESLYDRFSPSPVAGNSDHLIAVKLVGSQWYYDNNGGLHPFTPRATDLLIARVDFSSDNIASLEDDLDIIAGIHSGFTNGDLVFYADRWGASSNDGEFRVEGTGFER